MTLRLHRAAALRDAAGQCARPGAVLVQDGRIVAAGREQDLPHRLVKRARVVDHADKLLLPALVNAHAHLDLTGLGPMPFGGDFVAWLRQVIARRPKDSADIADAVRQGLALSHEAGVGVIGDIAGSAAAIAARRAAAGEALDTGVSYLECFGIGAGEAAGVDGLEHRLDDLAFETNVPDHQRGIVLGISPHSPYAAGLAVYRKANRLSRDRIYRLTTHLAESPEELEFVAHASGPFAELLKDLGRWDASIQPTGEHPVALLETVLRRGRWLAAHCNYVDDEHIAILHRTGTSVAYCPIASDYFGHRGHRYRDMLAAGVNVCLGTDSIVCQPVEVQGSKFKVQGLAAERSGARSEKQSPDRQIAKSPNGLGILPQMRYLYQRDGTDPDTLLAMATTRGMVALELRDRDATFHAGAPARFAAVPIDPDDGTDPLVQVLEMSDG